MKRNKTLIIFVSLFVFAFVLLSATSFFTLRYMKNVNTEQISSVMAARIHDSINSDISERTLIARSMANNEFLIDLLESENSYSQKQMASKLTKYLSAIEKRFDTSCAFVVSDSSASYFTSDGFSRHLNDVADYPDEWYQKFVEKDTEYDFNVDTDKTTAEKTLTVFINARILSDDGKLLGACGIGVPFSYMQNFISQFEQEYGITVSLLDADGTVKLCSDATRIDSTFEDKSVLANSFYPDYAYREKGNNYSVTKYLNALNWYLVIQGKNESNTMFILLLANMFAFAVVMIFMAITGKLIIKRTKALTKESTVDKLTGLFNRRAYEDKLDEIRKSSLSPQLNIIIFDLNGLKKINDGIGHAAGDELVKACASALHATFGKRGTCYRIGGDEFATVIEGTPDNIRLLQKNFESTVKNWRGRYSNELSVSVGFANVGEEHADSLELLIEIADDKMYEAKRAYYSKIGNDRRGQHIKYDK